MTRDKVLGYDLQYSKQCADRAAIMLEEKMACKYLENEGECWPSSTIKCLFCVIKLIRITFWENLYAI